MQTRSQTKAKMATRSNNSQINVPEVEASGNRETDFDINNQLGVVPSEGSVEVSEMEDVEETNSSRARGQEQENPSVDLRDIFNLIKLQAEAQQKQAEEQRQRDEELRRMVEEQKASVDAVRREVSEKFEAMREEMAQQRINWEKKFDQHQQKTTAEIKEISEKQDRLHREQQEGLARSRHELQEEIRKGQTNTAQDIKKLEEQVVVVSTAQKDTAEKFESVSVEKRRKLEELNNSLTTVKETQERLQRRLNDLDVRPANRPAGVTVSKEITYNGRDHFPMEFLKEISEVHEMYYKDDNTKWIGNHLTEEAATWWRIIRDQVRTFEEFRELFSEKYWGDCEQERVRTKLEHGRYHPGIGKSMIQYMEQCILESRQLQPVLSDRHLIKKIARHYDRDVQTAVIMRGIETIGAFEQLLKEYMNISPRLSNCQNNGRFVSRKETADVPTTKQEARSRDAEPEVNKNKPWRKTFNSDARYDKSNKPAVQCIVTQPVSQQASGESKPGPSRDSQQ